MRLRPEQLAKHLKGDLLPAYLVAGDEPLQQDEALDALRAAARERGFDERHRFSADTGIDWNALRNEAQSLSLFGGRRILEVVLFDKRPDKNGSAILRELLEAASPDTLLLIRSSRLDRRRDWNSAWVKALDGVGAVLEVWPVEGRQLQQWLRDRLAGRGLTIEESALELLIQRSEGNLLAAAQEVDKLALLAEDGKITPATVQQAVGDSSRYTPFDLTDALSAGDPARAMRILRTLRAEGVEAPVVLWALAREVRTLDALATGGAPPRLPPQRLRALQAQANRLPPRQIHRALALAIRADRAIKGMEPGDPWQHLAGLVMRLSGAPLPASLER